MHARTGDARQHVVIGRNMRRGQAYGQPRSTCTQSLRGFQDQDLPAPLSQAEGDSGTCHARADHDDTAVPWGLHFRR